MKTIKRYGLTRVKVVIGGKEYFLRESQAKSLADLVYDLEVYNTTDNY